MICEVQYAGGKIHSRTVAGRCEVSSRLKTETHRSKELLHVRRIRVDDQLEDFFVSDLPQNLPVRSGTRLTNVHFSSHGWRGFHEILQFEQPCKTQKRDIFSRQIGPLRDAGLHHPVSSCVLFFDLFLCKAVKVTPCRIFHQ